MNPMATLTAVCLLGLLLGAADPPAAPAKPVKPAKIILLAGPPSHGPGDHEK